MHLDYLNKACFKATKKMYKVHVKKKEKAKAIKKKAQSAQKKKKV